MFLLAGLYFVIVAGLGEGSEYTALGGVLCFIAVVLEVRKEWFVTGPWRAATAAFASVVFVAQLVANAYASSFDNVYQIGSTVLNGVFLILFAGVVLVTTRDIGRKSEEESAEEVKESKKLTYEV